MLKFALKRSSTSVRRTFCVCCKRLNHRNINLRILLSADNLCKEFVRVRAKVRVSVRVRVRARARARIRVRVNVMVRVTVSFLI